MNTNTINLTGGIDVGNGYVKAVVRNTGTGVVDEVDMPSAVVSMSRQNPKVPEPDASAQEVVTDGDFFNRLDCSMSTPLVQVSDRRILGRAALSIDGSKFDEFDVKTRQSKADQELSKVLV